MNEPDNLFLWIDFETNGHTFEFNGNPFQQAYPLEVAFIITDRDLNNVTSGVEKDRKHFHSYYHIPEHIFEQVKKNTPSAVYKMHEDNGLWDALIDVPARGNSVLDVDDRMERVIRQTIKDYNTLDWDSPDPDIILAGSGVSHYDFRYLESFCYKTWGMLKGYSNESKPSVDVGVVRRFIKHFTNIEPFTPPADTQHRALADVRQFIQEAAYYRESVWDFHLDSLPQS